MTTTTGPQAGWYPDPEGSGQLRWFDGSQWTTHLRAQDGGAGSPAQAPVGEQQAPAAVPQAPVPPQYSPAPQYSAGPARQYRVEGGCQQCGGSPAIAVKLRSHHGMLLMQRFLSYRATLCRDCGIA